MFTNPCSDGGERGGVKPASPAQVVVLPFPHFRVYSIPGVNPKFCVSAWLCASGAKGSMPPLEIEDCGFCPAVADADSVIWIGIPGSTGRKLRGTLAETVTVMNR